MELAGIIDHTILKPDCTKEDIQRICQEALQHRFKAICIPPFYIAEAKQLLANSPVLIATVIGFPMGYSAIPAKVEEIKRAINDGADEVDAVVNISAVKSKNWSHVRNDIDSMTRSAHMKGKVIKIILETGLMTTAEINQLCEICIAEGVDFVKTSTGFNAAGANTEIVTHLRSKLPKEIKIKASGGIRSRQEAEKLIAAGAERIGTSVGIQLIS